MTLQSVFERIDNAKDEIVNTLIEACKIPAIHPDSGGEGEAKKADFMKELLGKLGFQVKEICAPDDRVPSGVRPNLLVEYEGQEDRKLWIVSHMDIVPEGDLSKWDSDPFNPAIRDGKIYGRGVEDNGQAMIASLYALWAVKEEGVKPKNGCALAFVADEETGSEFGIQYLLDEKVFAEDDLIIVPDFSSKDGTEIEVAEKNILWLRIKTLGKQAHASLPHKAINAHRAGARLLGDIDRELHQLFKDDRDERFNPPFSTFEPTKKESNVPNINTVPGEDIFYFDCRILPKVHPDEIKHIIRNLANKVEKDHNVKIDISIIQEEMSPPTKEDSEVVLKLKDAIRMVRNVEPKAIGIGGGTCAAYFRQKGFDVPVWLSGDETAHSANEYCIIDNLIQDTKVFAAMFLSE